MKRHFMKSLKALGMGAMALVAASSLVVSCYDDSALRGEISGVKADLKGVKARLDSLENKLSSQITAVQALYAAVEELEGADETLGGEIDAVAAKIKVAEVKTLANGKVSVVLTDGTTFEVEPASKNANPVVTVVDGKWALVDAKTGQASVIEIDGAPVPVAHPGFKIRFNDSTRLIEVSVDGGTTWTASDVEIPEQQEIPECNALITKVEDGDKTVTFWMGEESITVAKVELVRFEILAGKLYFDVEETKKVDVELSGVKSVMLMKAPKGWGAEYENNVLTVTSPTEDAIWYDMTAEQEGDVEIWVATEDERLLVATLRVAIPNGSAPVAIKVSGTPEYEVSIYPGFGDVGMHYVRFGACPADEFDADEVYEAILEGGEGVYNIMADFMDKFNEEELATIVSLEELLGSAPEAGKQYVVWGIAPTKYERDYDTYEIVETFDKNDFVKVYVTPVFVNIEATDSTFNNVDLSVTVDGFDKYFAGYIPASNYDPESFDIQTYFNASAGMWGAPEGMWACYEEAFEGTLSEFASPDYESAVKVATEYVLFVVPMTKGDDVEEYTNADVTFKRVRTCDVVAGGSAVVEVDTENVSYDAIYPVITTDAALTFYRYYLVTEENTAEAIKARTDSSFVAEIIKIHKEGVMSETEEEVFSRVETEFVAAKHGIMPGTEFVLVSVAIDADGKYVVTKTDVASKEIPFADALELEITNVVAGPNSAALTFDITGECAKLAIYPIEKNANTDIDEESAEFRLDLANDYPDAPYGVTYVADTTAYVLENLALGKTYQILVVGVTEDGKFTEAVSTEVTTALSDDAVVLASDPSYFQPEIGFDANKDGVLDGLYYSYDKGGLNPLFYAWYTIKGSSDAAKVYYGTPYVNQISDADGNLLTGKALIEKVLSISMNEVSNPSEDYNYRFSSNWDYINGKNENVLWVMWTDADGKYYEPVILRTQQLARSIYSVADSKDYTFTATDNAVTPTKYVYKNFTVAAESTFYLRENAADDVKWGLATAGAVVAGTPATLVKSAEAQAFTLAAGTYNISFDIVANTLTVEAVE